MSELVQIEIPPAGAPRPRVTRSNRDLLAGDWPRFHEVLDGHGFLLERRRLTTLQVNVGKLCNQTCRHCHVEAGPTRTEQMTRRTAERVVELMDLPGARDLDLVDITGGAPELSPQFRFLAAEARARGFRVIDRCNLTVLFEPGQEDTAGFLRDHRIEVVASLPCYSNENVTRQRGEGVFGRSIEALQLLNSLGYGREGTGLVLDLVYNPVGAFLPPDQEELQGEYKERLLADFGIVFNRLYTITNMPVKRFLYDLKHSCRLEEYMTLLVNSFNLQAAENVMCRDLVSIGWEGTIYDCDFNQMLEMPVPGPRRSIWDLGSLDEFNRGPIAVADHCFGCTAGAGSSCGGSLD
ncbi:MAG: arsenosugar biosynthesis radical SAM protein ArsS [Gemmatimonadetes bacterium]|nr:arsenosugar biosynthesis radical SAM protein ArsS [Gemmatimonadota bacterium]